MSYPPQHGLLSPEVPPNYIRQATTSFGETMREVLPNLVGVPFSDWAWLKASLPCSHGGVNIRRATLHAPLAYISSLEQFRAMDTRILGQDPETPKNWIAQFML